MKLVVCSPMQFPAINGTTVYAKQLSDFFNAELISTNALDWIAFHSPRGKTHKKGFSITHLPELQDPKTLVSYRASTEGLSNAFINGPICPGLREALKTCDADIVYSLTLPFLNNYYALASGKKCVTTPFYIEGVVKKSHLKLLEKFNLVFACTEYEKECIGGDNVTVSPMCIDPELFARANGERFREKYGIEGPLVLFVGHANHEKGAYALLKAAKSVKATFAFMGPHTRGFKQKAKGLKNVKLINPQLTNKFDAFAACDCYCMPSRVEAFGITYLEAWACQKPVIAADTPVAREVVGENGLLVPFDSDPSNAINESFKRPDLGLKGYDKLMKNFTEDKVLKELGSLIHRHLVF